MASGVVCRSGVTPTAVVTPSVPKTGRFFARIFPYLAQEFYGRAFAIRACHGGNYLRLALIKSRSSHLRESLARMFTFDIGHGHVC